MVGAVHKSTPHEIIYDTPQESFDPNIIGVASTTTVREVSTGQPTITPTSPMIDNTSTTPTPPSSPPPSTPPSSPPSGGGYGGGY